MTDHPQAGAVGTRVMGRRGTRRFAFPAPTVVAGLVIMATACLPGDLDPGIHAPDVDEIPALALEEVARIGSMDDPDYGFSRVGSVDVDADGNVYVFESQDREIRVYSSDGELLRRMGGAGDGPGEFGGPSTPTFGVQGDTVWAFDPSAGRITLFSRVGDVLSTSRVEDVTAMLHGPGQWVRIWPRAMDTTGLFVGDRGMSAAGEAGGPVADTVRIPRIRFDANGGIVDTVGWYPLPRPPGAELIDVGSSRFVLPWPPGSDPVLVTHAHGLIRIDQTVPEGPDLFRITRLDHAGDTVRTTTLRFEPKPFRDEVLNSLAVRSAHRVGTMVTMIGPGEGIEMVEARAEDTAAARRAILREMPFPETQRPVQSTFMAADGALWLRREDMGGDRYRWTVLDAEDWPVGELELPRTTRLAWTDGGRLWTIERDDLEVPWLVGYRVRVP